MSDRTQPPKGYRLLVAEDDLDNRGLIQFMLSDHDLEIRLVDNGRQAVTAALDSQFDLILMDMQMPVMSGYEAAQELRSRGVNIPIVALTASTRGQCEARCLEAGCNEVLPKPFLRREFHEMLQRYLGSESRRETESAAVLPLPSILVEEDTSYLDVVRSFVDRLPARLLGLEQAYAGADWGGLAEQAHRAAGAKMFGFPSLAEEAQQLEQAAKEQAAERAAQHLARLKQLYRRAEAGISLAE